MSIFCYYLRLRSDIKKINSKRKFEQLLTFKNKIYIIRKIKNKGAENEGRIFKRIKKSE